MGIFSRLFGGSQDQNLNESTEEAKTGNPNNELNESIGLIGGVAGEQSEYNFNAIGGIGGLSGFEGNFIGDSFYDTGGVFGRPFLSPGLQDVEKSYIMKQRTISLYPEVAIGIEEILRDLFDKDDALELDAPTDYDKLEAITKLFELFKKNTFTLLTKSKTPQPLILFNFLKQAYIDGRIAILSVKVNEEQIKSLGDGLQPKMHGMRGTILNESMVHWASGKQSNLPLTEEDVIALLESKNDDPTDSKEEGKIRIFIPIDPVKVTEEEHKIYISFNRANRVEVNPKNLIQSDFGLFDVVGARHGFLLYAFKYANQLQALQDMLIPIRFRRSVARRVFNVDISNLPQNRALSYMQDLQNKFRYKKHYDVSTGKIVSKTNEPTGIVEDYWFGNRSGGKGTTVETIDEAGNFQDSLEDISYFNKKLYQSMFIPLRRIFESDASYDYTANSIEVDELRFISFLERVRFVFNTVLTRMFRMMLEDMGVESEVIGDVNVLLRYDNWYEKAKIKEDFENGLDLWDSSKELIGKLFSAETLIEKSFGMTLQDLQAEQDKIKEELEESSPYYKVYMAFANNSDDSDY